MTEHFLRAVARNLTELSLRDRRSALSALAAQLAELQDAGLDPHATLGDPVVYAAALESDLADDEGAAQPPNVLGMPVELRGPLNAKVRSRIWDPANPKLLVPRLFGVGWTLNLGAIAVRLGLLRPDDADGEVLAQIPERAVRAGQVTPLLIAGVTTTSLALAWSRIPARVPTKFTFGGRPARDSSKAALLGFVALGLAPAIWAQRGGALTEDRLGRAAGASSLAVLAAGSTAASVASSLAPKKAGHAPRWGLLTLLSLPIAVATSLAAVVVPIRIGLKRTWHSDQSDLAPTKETP